MRWESKFIFFHAYGYPIVTTPFVEKAVISIIEEREKREGD